MCLLSKASQAKLIFGLILKVICIQNTVEYDLSNLTLFWPENVTQAVDRVIKNSPIIDGHNDLALNYRLIANNDLRKVDLKSDISTNPLWYEYNYTQTDIGRMRASGYGGQFWSAYTACSSQYKDSVAQTLEQIDVIKRFVNLYPEDFYYATSVRDIEEAMKQKKIASLIGVEGGHSISSNYGILRIYYELGVRYLTLTHNCSTPWATSSPFSGVEDIGLTDLGLGVIDEMNRLGMMVDLSHTSVGTMKAALKRSRAPVIFSHSGAKAIFNHHRNVPDDVLGLVKSTDSIIMINLYSGYLRENRTLATIEDVIAHADHIRNVVGPDHIGIGGDYDGVDLFPPGLENVSKLRNLVSALYASGHWSEEDLEKMTSRNILRVLSIVEEVRDTLRSQPPLEEPLLISNDLKDFNQNCFTDKFF